MTGSGDRPREGQAAPAVASEKGGRDGSVDQEMPRAWGICADCFHARVVRSKRSAFMRCGLSDEDAEYLRYPPLPVLECSGFRQRVSDATPRDTCER